MSAVLSIAVIAVAALNVGVIRAWFAEDLPVDFRLPIAAAVDQRPGETVYVVDAAASRVVVGVDEELVGTTRRVELTTRSVAGEIAVAEDGSARVAEIVVGVDQFRSDNALRDKMLHHEFLESHSHRLVRLRDIVITLPQAATTRSATGATVEASLEVKGVEHPTTWSVDAEIDGDSLIATATTMVTMSELGVGPISKAGLVRTSNEMDVVVELVATKGHVPPTGLVDHDIVVTNDEGATADAPSFRDDVLPILEANCASCHTPGELGATMWPLAVARNAAEVADGLALVTASGYMPPWPASEVGVELMHPRRLSDDDIATIAQWAEAGGPLDVDPMTPIEPPRQAEGPTPRADVRVGMPEPYKGTPEQRDDYRCFILDPQITEPTFMTGYVFEPDQLGTVHHAVVTRARAEQVPDLQAQDEADDGPGWGCLAGMGFGLGDRVGGWVPGQGPVKLSDGDGFDLQPGDVLVAQMHYHYNPGVPADQSAMTLELTPGPGITPVRSSTLIGPVELPCTEAMHGPLCDRSASIDDVVERFGPGAQRIANGLHVMCGSTVEGQVATFDGRFGATTCDFRVTASGQLTGFLAHMHEIGSSYRMTHNPGTPSETVLLDIPVWNFDWQLGYTPVEEVRLVAGDILRVTCRWDRELRHEVVPRYIVFAEGTEDEMCYTALTVRPG